MCPRNCGPDSFHALRAGSLTRFHNPLRVAMRRRTRAAAALRGDALLVRGIGFPPVAPAPRGGGRTKPAKLRRGVARGKPRAIARRIIWPVVDAWLMLLRF